MLKVISNSIYTSQRTQIVSIIMSTLLSQIREMIGIYYGKGTEQIQRDIFRHSRW